MNPAFSAIIIIISSYLFTRVSKLIKIPSVVALILLGLVIGLPPIEKLLIHGHTEFITILGDIGLLALMFMAGVESSWHLLNKEKKDAAYIAIFAAFIPMAIGFAAFYMLNYSFQTALIIGIAISISAEATRAKVLMEMNKLQTRVGAALIGAGLIDDALGLSLFVLLTYFMHTAGTAEELLVAGSLICFFLGLAVKRLAGRENLLIAVPEQFFNYLLIPFFFVSIGLHFDYRSLLLNPSTLAIIIVIATIGKFIGVFATKPFLDFNFKQLHLIGWSMNSRGALEMALALVAYRSNLLSEKLYSSLVIMALVTTLVFPFVITPMIHKDPDIMK